METKFKNTENSKTNKPRKFVLNFSQRLDLESSSRVYCSSKYIGPFITRGNISRKNIEQ